MQNLYNAIEQLADTDQPIAVALSGGADSVALLYATAKRWPKQVIAFHIRHGLQPKDPEFAQQCRDVCQQLQVPLTLLKVNAHPVAGQSPEDAARKARYIGLTQLAQQQQCASILLAHHADDQVETMLLALTRGAGLAGMAAMASSFTRHGCLFRRPFLQLSGKQIRQILQDNNISYIEDPTNQDIKYTRNKIRLKILPQLEQYFPQYRSAFLRSSRLAAQGHQLLEELAQLDLENMDGKMVIKQLQQLSPQRQANLVRYWLKSNWQAIGSEAQMQALLRQIECCRSRGHKIDLKMAQGKIHRLGEFLVFNP